MHALPKIAEQLRSDFQSNFVATATLEAAGAGFKWRVTSWRASYSGLSITAGFLATVTGLESFTIDRGVTSSDAWEVNLTAPLDSANNGTVSITLPAGGVGATGAVSIHAYKVPITLTDG